MVGPNWLTFLWTLMGSLGAKKFDFPPQKKIFFLFFPRETLGPSTSCNYKKRMNNKQLKGKINLMKEFLG